MGDISLFTILIRFLKDAVIHDFKKFIVIRFLLLFSIMEIQNFYYKSFFLNLLHKYVFLVFIFRRITSYFFFANKVGLMEIQNFYYKSFFLNLLHKYVFWFSLFIFRRITSYFFFANKVGLERVKVTLLACLLDLLLLLLFASFLLPLSGNMLIVLVRMVEQLPAPLPQPLPCPFKLDLLLLNFDELAESIRKDLIHARPILKMKCFGKKTY